MAKTTTEKKTEAPAPANKAVAKTITVIAKRSLFENGKSYTAGDEVETTAERAKALGGAVEVE